MNDLSRRLPEEITLSDLSAALRKFDLQHATISALAADARNWPSQWDIDGVVHE